LCLRERREREREGREKIGEVEEKWGIGKG
jgi:hypothetical protein